MKIFFLLMLSCVMCTAPRYVQFPAVQQDEQELDCNVKNHNAGDTSCVSGHYPYQECILPITSF